MICYRCGREMPDKSPYCKGCGTQLRRSKKVSSTPIVDVLKSTIPVGKKCRQVWQVLLSLVLVCSLLIAGLYLVPPMLRDLELPEIDIFAEPEEPADPSTIPITGSVTGSIITCSVSLPESTVVTDEKAFSDGSWQKDCVVDEQINMRFVRRPAAENWINTHIFQLYPDVTAVDQFTESPQVSGYDSSRIQFGSDNAPGCIIQTLYVSDGSFDHLFIVETPLVMFDEQSIFVDEWFSHLMLVDATTGAENLNPAVQLQVSSVDVLPVIE